MTVEVECFLTGDGKGMCVGHTKLKCRCWHCDLAFEDFGGDNLRPSDFIISVRWGAFLRSIPPTRRVGDVVHCCCRIVNAIFKRLCLDGRISQARALGPLLRSVVQSVMQAAAHIPSEIRDAPRPTKDGNFDLVGGRWQGGGVEKKFARIPFSYPPPHSGVPPEEKAGTPCRNFFSLGGIFLLCAF